MYHHSKISDCRDITMDSCHGYVHAFETLDLSSEEKCQKYCSEVYSSCRFFIFDRENNDCQLFDYDSLDYSDSCTRVAAKPTPPLAECEESDDECLVRLFSCQIEYEQL